MPEYQQTTTPATKKDDAPATGRAMTTERYVALYMLGALGFLVLVRRAFSDFVPR